MTLVVAFLLGAASLAVTLAIARWGRGERVTAKRLPTDGAKPGVICSFCGKHQDEVRKIIAGPNAWICDECIDLCNDVIEEDFARTDQGSVAAATMPVDPGLTCLLCHLQRPIDELVMVPDRGSICFVCVDAIKTASEP